MSILLRSAPNSSLPRLGFTDNQIGRLEALRVSLQRTDRVMAESRTVSLGFDYTSDKTKTIAPAYLSGEHITVCIGWIEDPASQEGLVHILGLNAHELAHYLYSVGVENLKKRWNGGGAVLSKQFGDAYRILEDQRIETLMSAKYRRTEKYFSYPVIAHMVNDQNTWPTAFLFTHGRRYLPKNVRETFRTIFEEGQFGSDAKAFAKIIDEYRVLSFTTAKVQQHAAKLVNDFAKLLDSAMIPNQSQAEDHMASAMSLAGEDTDEDARIAVLITEKQDREGGADGSQGSGRGDGEDDGEEEDQNPSGGGKEGNGDDDSGQDPTSQNSGVSTGGVTSQKLQQELAEAVSAIVSSHEMVNDVRDLLRAMNDRSFGMTTTLSKLHTTKAAVTPDMVEESSRMQEEFRRLWTAMDPGWVWDQPDGRVDMNRAALARDPEDFEHIYTSWDEGQQENSRIRVVAAVDFSSSMQATDGGKKSRLRSASEAMWELKFSLQEIESQLTALAFSDDCYGLYDCDDTVQRDRFDVLSTGGGTNPLGALQEGRRILNASEFGNKLLVVVTDGEWYGGNKEYPKVIDSTDAIKLAILIGPVRFEYTKHFDVVVRVSDARQIFPAVGSTVTRIIERNVR